MIISKKVASVDNFFYHWRCADEKITHLCFADDLILFCGHSHESTLLLKQALDLFFSLSGLEANHSKSDIFIAGSDVHFKEFLLEVFGFQLGNLPARHLGVPLISTKLSSRDYKILLEKIVARIKSWTTKHLSYGGRLQLIKLVLFILQVYWMGQFILPKQVTDQVEQLLRSFLWSGTDKKLKGAKVLWEDITCLKSEGGLGIKKTVVWNKACMAKLIWNLCQINSPSIWVNWAKNHLIREHSFWEIPIPNNCSWTWRKLLQLRERFGLLYIMSMVMADTLHFGMALGSRLVLFFPTFMIES